MAHPPGTAARLQRLSALVAIALVAIAVGLAFGRILVGHSATYRMVAIGIASGLIAWLTERRGMVLATLASAAALVLALAWLAAPNTTWYGLPTLDTMRTLGTLATQVGAQAREYVSPAPATPALVMAGSIAVWAAVFSCYALAFRAQSPLLSLVPPIALVVFADSVLDDFERPLYGVLFLLAALAVLFADSLRRIRGWGPVWTPTGAQDRLLPVAGRNARRVGLTAVVLAAFAPVLVPGFGTTAVLDISRFGSDNRIRVSPLVSMGSLLDQATNEGDNPEIFRVTASEGSYWRMAVLDTFDGNTWEAVNDEGVQLDGSTIEVAPPAGISVSQTYTITHDLGFGWLVAAADPTDISIDHDVWWHPASASLQMDGWPDEGETYTVTSVRPDVRPKVLRGADVVNNDPIEVALPDDIPPIIKQTAQTWTANAPTPYEKILAILGHLRDGDFRYSLDVDYGDDSQALVSFLQERKGFCQQFASLTAVMLRSLGIPARVALGFTEGTPAGQHSWAVTLKQYHAWVEVPFHGYGWLSFDPTPRFNDPSATWQPSERSPVFCGGGPQCSPGGEKGGGTDAGFHDGTVKGGTQVQPDIGGGPATATIPTTADRRVTLGTLLAGAAALLGVLGIAIPVARGIRRRRRLHEARDPREVILARYDVFADRARELGWQKAPGETPEEFRRRLAAFDALGEDAREPLSRLTATVVRAAYSPSEPRDDAVQAVEEDTATVLHRLREVTPLTQRLAGHYRRS